MSIEWIRDLVISITGIVVICVLIFIAVLSYIRYRQTRAIMKSLKTTAKTIEGVTSIVGDEVAKPMMKAVTFIQGMRMGINLINKFIKRKEDAHD